MPPPNDNLINAQLLTGQSPIASGTTVDSTNEAGEITEGLDYGAGDVWYLWKAPNSGTVKFTLTADSMDGEFDVYSGNKTDSWATIRGNYLTFNSLSGFGGSCSTTQTVIVGNYYLIQVCYYTVASAFSLDLIYTSIVIPPSNDYFTQAQTMATSSLPISADNTYATTEVGEPSSQTNSVWYFLNSPTSGRLSIACDTQNISVYNGSILADLDLVKTGTSFSIPIYANLDYYIVVWGNGDIFNLTGTFTQMDILVNDYFSGATVLTGDALNVSADNSMATTQLFEDPTNYFSMWYSYNPSTSGTFTLAQTSGIPLTFKIYHGSSIESLVQLVSSNNSVELSVQEGTIYYIAVCSQDSTTYGAFSFSGSRVNGFPLEYIGPSSPSFVYNSNNGYSNNIVVYGSKIFLLEGFINVYYSNNDGNTWVLDRTFPSLSSPLQYMANPAIFFDENENVVVMLVIAEGNNVYHFQASVRNKSSGAWTDYTSDSLSMADAGGGGWSTTWSYCQGDDGMIHVAMTYERLSVSGFILGTCNNIMYCNFKDGTFSSLTPITQYNTNEGAGFTGMKLVNHNSQILIFWRVYSVIYQWYDGSIRYCPITPASPLVMDAVEAAKNWGTGLNYYVGDLVVDTPYSPGTIYICQTNHASGVFATDLGSGKWLVLSSYATPTLLDSSFDNYDIYEIKSNGSLYFMIGSGFSPTFFTLFKDYVNIQSASSWVSWLGLLSFEIAMNDDMIVYGLDQRAPGTPANIVTRLNGKWGDGYVATNNAYPFFLHTYNFAGIS